MDVYVGIGNLIIEYCLLKIFFILKYLLWISIGFVYVFVDNVLWYVILIIGELRVMYL